MLEASGSTSVGSMIVSDHVVHLPRTFLGMDRQTPIPPMAAQVRA